MTRLDRYIIQSFLSAIGMVLIAFFVLFFVMNVLNESRQVGQGDYGFGSALQFVILTLPRELERFFPMIFLMSGLLLFSRLTERRELLAMLTFGVPLQRVVGVCMLVVLGLSMVFMSSAEWWTSHAVHVADQRKQMQLNQGQAISTPYGLWLHVDQAYIHIRSMLNRDQLHDVTVYQFDRNEYELRYVEYARLWKFQNKKWHVFDVKRTIFSESRLMRERLPQYESSTNLNPQLLNVGVLEASDLSLKELYLFAENLEKNHINSSEYKFAFWMKMFQPVLAMCMVIFSLYFVMKWSFRIRLGFRMMMGLVFGFLFFLVINFLGQMTVLYDGHPLFSAMLVPILSALLSVKLLYELY